MSAPEARLRLEARDGGQIAFVTLDDETRLNVFGSALMASFVQVMDGLRNEQNLRAVVLTGAGKRAFVAGADILEMAEIDGPPAARAFIGKVHACCEAVRACPAPVIARINGHALGAGLELAAACDLRIAADTASFGMPEVKVGVPSVVEAALLPGLIGWARTREMLLLGLTYDAEAAGRMGLVDEVVPPGALDAAVEAKVAALLDAKPGAVRLQKALIRRWEELPMREAIAAGVDTFAEAFLTSEPREATAAWKLAREARKKRC
jgi:enoyl-CoA hydratase/carnithine racemase